MTIQIRSVLAVVLFAAVTSPLAAETSHLAFVTEYVREFGVNEHMRALAEHDVTEVGSD